MSQVIQLNRQKAAFEQALNTLKDLPVRQIVVCVEFSDRPEEVIFYGNPKKIFPHPAVSLGHCFARRLGNQRDHIRAGRRRSPAHSSYRQFLTLSEW